MAGARWPLSSTSPAMASAKRNTCMARKAVGSAAPISGRCSIANTAEHTHAAMSLRVRPSSSAPATASIASRRKAISSHAAVPKHDMASTANSAKESRGDAGTVCAPASAMLLVASGTATLTSAPTRHSNATRPAGRLRSGLGCSAPASVCALSAPSALMLLAQAFLIYALSTSCVLPI